MAYGVIVVIAFVLLCCDSACVQNKRKQQKIQPEKKRNCVSPRLSHSFTHPQNNLDAFFGDYQRLDKIHEFVHSLNTKNPSATKVFSIGKSGEGRDLKVIKIESPSPHNKPAIWIDGGIHAREWISPPTVLYIAQQLLLRSSKPMIDAFDWYILPVLNPDGYEYTHTKNRFWRKNRNGCDWMSLSNPDCCGVDLNRNFGFHWREGGASNDLCHETYAGPSAFSEAESRSLATFILKTSRKQRFAAFLTFHSFGQYWFTPFGWTTNLPADYQDMVAVANKAVAALGRVYGTQLKVSSSSRELNIGSGGEDDWAYGVARIKYTYTVELRDKGKHGFDLPKEQIPFVVTEIWEAIKAFSRAIQEQGRSLKWAKEVRKVPKNVKL